ncbi:MAG: group II intron reverse transcriptase/maturase [Clostridiales bacterium]|nr:group II intron reverse transcriptase/maturase [Clostridiales bacterium]
MQSVFDELYENSLAKREFKNLVSIITTEENIRLAYRNLKKNAGSKTPGTDGKNIADLAKMSEPVLIQLVQRKLAWYQPQSVRRKEIPKGNGKTRPLGIPTIMDRLIQQCVLQVMEPICEAKFCETSNGFRPNRGVENALAQAEKHMQQGNLHIVIDIDIKGFFDNVNHGKLLRQIWAMGIHDKKLLSIISAMLKAEVAGIGFPEKGTPQGGIISPLLSNIVLNELDWWITSQWVGMPTRHEYSGRIHANGTKDQSKKYRELRKTKLKECYIVRYADDFKIFCKRHSDAVKLFEATKAWLKDRLELDISPEKSKIVNLKHEYSDFLGFQIKVHKGKNNKYVVISHISPKALDRIKDTAKEKIKAIQHSSGDADEFKGINDYNSFVMGIHNYYCMATAASSDIQRLAFEIKISIKNRLQERVKRRNDQAIPEYAKRYSKSKEVRYIGKNILLPIGYIQHHPPIHKKKLVNKYTVEGRAEIHKNLESVNMTTLHILMRNPIMSATVEYNDNRISLYVAQQGKCAITKEPLFPDEIHCHHKKPKSLGGGDNYANLIILHERIHKLIHATQKETISAIMQTVQLNKQQLEKLNKLRKSAGNKAISFEQKDPCCGLE